MNLDIRLLRLIRPARTILVLAVLLGCAGGFVAIAQAGTISTLVDRVFLGRQGPGEVRVLLALLLLLILARAGLAWGTEVAALRAAIRVKETLRARLFDRLLALGPAYLAGERSGELTATAVTGVEALEAYVAQYLPQLVWAAAVPLTILAFVFPRDPLSGVVLLLTGPLVPFFMILIGKAAETLTRRQYQALGLMSAHFLDVLQGLTTLKLLGRSRAQIETVARVSARFRDTTLGVLRVAFLSAFALEMIATLSTAIVAVEVGLRLLYGHMAFVDALFVLILAPEFYAPLRQLGVRFHAGIGGATAAQRIFEVMETPATEDTQIRRGDAVRVILSKPRESAPARRGKLWTRTRDRMRRAGQTPGRSEGSAASMNGVSGVAIAAMELHPTGVGDPSLRPAPCAATAQRGYRVRASLTRRGRTGAGLAQDDNSTIAPIRFDDVHYTYPDGRTALNGVSFTVAPGEHVALVGPSGAGKSTIAALLLRFAAPQHGTILAGDTPLGALPAREWRGRVAWVPQAPYLFGESVAANLRRARPDASDADVERAAAAAHAGEFVLALPQGYDTPIGERGLRLSGGQAQRLALARAFLKDAPILILDEATSNLDVETEALITAATAALRRGRTTITIAHRLSTAARADRIIVLDAGRVAESGTHAELMARRGVYWSMVQASGDTGPHPALPRSHTALTGEGAIPPPRALFASGGGQGGARRGPVTDTPSPLLRLLSLAAPFAGAMALAVVLGALTIASSVALMGTSAYIIAAAALHPSVAELQVAIIGVRAFGIARGVFRYLERLVSHRVNFDLLARLRVWFYAALEPLAPARLQQLRSADLLSRIVGDVETLQNFFVRLLAPPLVAALVALGMGVWLYGYAPGLAAAVLALMAVAGLALPLALSRLGRTPGRRLPDVQADLHVQLVDGLQGAADLLALGQERAQAERVGRLSRELGALQARMAVLSGFQSAAGLLLANLALWSVLALAIPAVAAGQLPGVLLATLALATLASFEGVQALPGAFQYLESNREAARRLFEVVDAPPPCPPPLANYARGGGEPVPAPATKSLRSPAGSQRAGAGRVGAADFALRVEDLTFRYSPDAPPALAGVSLELRPGRRVAVVGPSGAGKSTLVNVLLRFWDYESGTITLGGRDLRDQAPDDVRACFGVVSQGAHLFNASVRENLRLARPEASDDEIAAAARQAQIDDFVRTLPQGYDTLIGERGMRLSGGERRRVAIARALLKDAPIVILDEATADLDALTARDVLAAVRALTADRAVLVITHRLAGLEDADEILVLHGGRVLERGTHADLLRAGGWYARMIALQAPGGACSKERN